MSVATRNILNQVRLIGGAVAFVVILWVFIDPKRHGTMNIREILFALFGLPAGAAALALQIDKKSEI